MVEKAFEIKTVDDVCQTVVPPAKIPKTEYLLSGDYNIIDQSQQYIGGYTNDEATLFPNDDYILFGDHTCALKYYEGRFAQGADGLKALTVRDRNLYNPAYIYYAMSTVDIPTSYDRHWSQMASAEIPVPPLSEQRAIAAVLSDIDALIKKQHNLIEKKKRFRDGMKTELIVNADGDEYALSDIAFYAKESVPSSSVPKGNYVSVESLRQNVQGRFPMNAPTNTSCKKFRKGDTLLGNIRPYLKKIALADGNGGTNGDVLVIRPLDDRKVLPEFLYYALSTNEFFDYNSSQSVGTKMPRGDKAVIMDYKITVPEYKQQQLIADTLDNIDKELHALQIALDKAKQLKTALLRRLITGEIRIL